MISVNYIQEMKGAPAWSQHVPAAVDDYSVADLVFPWFLFLVGVSIPLSLGKFLDGARAGALGRIAPRVLGLLLVGLIFANEERHDDAATGMGHHLWLFLVLTAVMVLPPGCCPPGGPPARQRIERAGKVGAAVLLAVLLALWRGKATGGGVSWLGIEWWGFLGLDWLGVPRGGGRLPARAGRRGGPARRPRGPDGDRVLGRSTSGSGRSRPCSTCSRSRRSSGSLSAMVVAGAVAGRWLTRPQPGRAAPALFGLALWTVGWFLRPLHGYHKESASESWALVAAGQASLLLAGLHEALDRRRLGARVGGAFALVGRNALLAYVLPEWLAAFDG